MRDGLGILTARPQITHMLFRQACRQSVDMLWMNRLLLSCNSPQGCPGRLYGRGFLPTMKLQLSQLP